MTADTFWPRVAITEGCWLWQSGLDVYGYGRYWRDGTHRRAHREAYERLIGPIPAGLQLDHLCRVRHCVNPTHLEPVTTAENTRRGRWATATHCVNGHEFTPDNTYLRPDGRRQCRTCNRAHRARYDAIRQARATGQADHD